MPLYSCSMIAAVPSIDVILGPDGKPLPKSTSKVRKALAESFAEANAEKVRAQRRISARYDSAGSGKETENIWENTDSLDADSANSKLVRHKLVHRSRYEIANNGYADGIASTYATDLIGMGPSLRMQTASEGFNRMVERAWAAWTKEVRFRQKLWTMAHAKHSDGEAFAVIRQNRAMRHPVKLGLVLHETEQCQTQYMPYDEENCIDGIKFDDFGNPLYYDFLRNHPGSTNVNQHYWDHEQVPAKFVLHWFKAKRPGQHRGIPEMTSTLNLGATARRYREAVVAAAETAADFSLLIQTNFEPDEMDEVSPMTSTDIQKRMMTALPKGYEANQLKAEHPTSTFEAFHKTLISEQARPRSMPLNKAAADSSNYNYASGRLDHQTYYGSLDVERADCNDMTLDPLFRVWFEAAVMAYGWLGGNPDALSDGAASHTWDWPKHQVADIVSEEKAADMRLKNGRSYLAAEQIASGHDPEDELIKQAESNGVSVDQQRRINMLLNVPQHAIQYVAKEIGIETAEAAPGQSPEPSEEETADA